MITLARSTLFTCTYLLSSKCDMIQQTTVCGIGKFATTVYVWKHVNGVGCMCACVHACTYCIFPLVLYISVFYGCNMFRVSPAGVLGNLFFGLSLSDSIEHRRVHHQLEPDTVFAEGMCFSCIASASGCWTPECMLSSPRCPCDSHCHYSLLCCAYLLLRNPSKLASLLCHVFTPPSIPDTCCLSSFTITPELPHLLLTSILILPLPPPPPPSLMYPPLPTPTVMLPDDILAFLSSRHHHITMCNSTNCDYAVVQGVSYGSSGMVAHADTRKQGRGEVVNVLE